MTNRPFFSKSVIELEEMFNERQSEPEFLDVLMHELEFRHVNRAKELKAKVINAINNISHTTASSDASNKTKQIPAAVDDLVKDDVVQNVANLVVEPKVVTKVFPAPEIKNSPDDILSAWAAIEVLSPQSFKKPEELVSDDKWRISYPINGKWIWEAGGENSQPKKRLYYQIVLGTVSMEPSVEALLKVYTDTRVELPIAQGEAILATVMVDKFGRPLDAESIGISSFGWGIPVALNGNLNALGQWQGVERNLVQGLARQLKISTDPDVESLPLTFAQINHAYDWLVKELGLDTSLTKRPAFAIKTYQYYLNNNPPEAILLNSFFLEDLNKVRGLAKSGALSSNLKRYLGVNKPANRHNLLEEKESMSDTLQPKKFPLSSWPAMGNHPLVTLQQCAVNLAADIKQDGILAVNGPPGTGKTTLLRDIVAAIVAERADVMATYNDPQDAFIHAGQVKRGQSFIHLYKLNDNLRGYEIVVASSNNKAVENVSAELPGINAISADATNLRYFKTVSDKLLGRDTWGAIAAVLGNSQNRYAFISGFWWDSDFGMQKYLQHVCGVPQLIPDPENEDLIRPPRVIEFENPPSNHDEALIQWEKARKQYKRAKKVVQDSLEELQVVYEMQKDVEIATRKLEALQDRVSVEIETLGQLSTNLKEAEAVARHQSDKLDKAEIVYHESKAARPGFFSRIFRTASYMDWAQKHQPIVDRLEIVRNEYKRTNASLSELKARCLKLDSSIRQFKNEIGGYEIEINRYNNKIAEIKSRYPGVYINQTFFSQTHHQKQIAVPWIGPVIAKQRNELFAASIALEKAFVDAAAKPIRHNMNLLMDGFGMTSLGNAERDEVIPHLWATLFLLVPVVSTTFASVGRMFKNIGSEELGWLLIDEAGQALPQAAVGALHRTKKAVIVGDPIQIEPIVVLPNLLTESICRQFGVDPLGFNAPTASAQTLADDASQYFATYETKIGTRKVGVPLLVHRRCSAPMFDISNIVAYENMMVQAKVAKESPIMNVLGSSHWLDVVSSSQDKWSQAEGEKVMILLQQLKAKGCVPDLYIITPFVVVQDRLRQLIAQSKILNDWVDNPRAWPYQRVGTVHTVQGREADAVIFVLGAPNAEQRGARAWAGGSPNLLNVATTRAKEAIYVIGNRELWKTAGHFETLARMLP